MALRLIDQCLARGYCPGVSLVDAGYGNNSPFLKQLEARELSYIAALAKNRRVWCQLSGDAQPMKYRLDEVARTLDPQQFTAVQLHLQQPRTVWVALVQLRLPQLEGQRWVAIELNAPTFAEATEVDYLLSNTDEQVSPEWIAQTYSQRNWVEVFYREAKGWLGLSEYQIRDAKSMKRHWILVFSAYTFILWHQLTGGIRRRGSTKALETFGEVMEAFRTAVEFRFVQWLTTHVDVFAAHKDKFGLVWA